MSISGVSSGVAVGVPTTIIIAGKKPVARRRIRIQRLRRRHSPHQIARTQRIRPAKRRMTSLLF